MMKITKFASFLSVFVMFIAMCVPCVAADEGVSRISIVDLKNIMVSGTNVAVLDVRPKIIYDTAHIRDAISFPWKKDITRVDVKDLPKDKLIVTYCDCEGDSADVAVKLVQMGFVNVKVLEHPGLLGWERAGYPVEGK